MSGTSAKDYSNSGDECRESYTTSVLRCWGVKNKIQLNQLTRSLIELHSNSHSLHKLQNTPTRSVFIADNRTDFNNTASMKESMNRTQQSAVSSIDLNRTQQSTTPSSPHRKRLSAVGIRSKASTNDAICDNEEIQLELAGKGLTNLAGIYRCTIDREGSYIVQVSSPGTQLQRVATSHVIRVSAPCRTTVVMSLQPMLVSVLFVVAIDPNKPINRFKQFQGHRDLRYTDKGMCVSLVNMVTNKRYIVTLHLLQPEEVTPQVNRHLMADLQKRGIWSEEIKDLIIASKGMVQDVEEIPENLRVVYKNNGLKGMSSSSSKEKKGGWARFKAKKMRAKKAARGAFWRDAGFLDDADEDMTYLAGEALLPVGKYYSEVDGSILRVRVPPGHDGHEHDMSNNNNSSTSSSSNLHKSSSAQEEDITSHCINIGNDEVLNMTSQTDAAVSDIHHQDANNKSNNARINSSINTSINASTATSTHNNNQNTKNNSTGSNITTGLRSIHTSPPSKASQESMISQQPPATTRLNNRQSLLVSAKKQSLPQFDEYDDTLSNYDNNNNNNFSFKTLICELVLDANPPALPTYVLRTALHQYPSCSNYVAAHEVLAVKCHTRLCLRAGRILQRLYLRKSTEWYAQNVDHCMRVFVYLQRYVKKIRLKRQTRAAVRLQTIWRKVWAQVRFMLIRRGVIRLQSERRRIACQKKFQYFCQIARKRSRVMLFMLENLYLAIQDKKNACVVKLQSVWLMYRARSRYLEIKRIEHDKKVQLMILARQQKEDDERKAEMEARVSMQQEEVAARLYMKRQAQWDEEQRLLHVKMEEERVRRAKQEAWNLYVKRHNAATKIQALARRSAVRKKFFRTIRAVIKVQSKLRMKYSRRTYHRLQKLQKQGPARVFNLLLHNQSSDGSTFNEDTLRNLQYGLHDLDSNSKNKVTSSSMALVHGRKATLPSLDLRAANVKNLVKGLHQDPKKWPFMNILNSIFSETSDAPSSPKIAHRPRQSSFEASISSITSSASMFAAAKAPSLFGLALSLGVSQSDILFLISRDIPITTKSKGAITKMQSVFRMFLIRRKYIAKCKALQRPAPRMLGRVLQKQPLSSETSSVVDAVDTSLSAMSISQSSFHSLALSRPSSPRSILETSSDLQIPSVASDALEASVDNKSSGSGTGTGSVTGSANNKRGSTVDTPLSTASSLGRGMFVPLVPLISGGLRSLINMSASRKQSRECVAAAAIQAMVRGALCRTRVYRQQMQQFSSILNVPETISNVTNGNASMNSRFQDEDIAPQGSSNSSNSSPPRFRPNLAIVTTPFHLDTTDSSSPASSIGSAPNTAMSSIAGATPRFLKKLAAQASAVTPRGALMAVTSGVKSVADTAKSVTDSVQNVASLAAHAAQDFMERQQQARARHTRREQGETIISDALLNIRGLSLSDLPSLDRRWYLGVFPKASSLSKGVEVDLTPPPSWQMNDASIPGSSSSSASSASSVSSSAPSSVSLMQQMWQGSHFDGTSDRTEDYPDYRRHLQEASKTTFMYPFNTAELSRLNFFAHLSDLVRYKSVTIVLFLEYIEGSEEANSLQRNKILQLQQQQLLNKKNVTQEEIEEAHRLYLNESFGRVYVPLFHGECSIGRGSTFAPSGGRMFVTLRPHLAEIMKMPHPQKLLALGGGTGITVLTTLMPVALPSSSFLRTFRDYSRIAPVNPSSLVDGSLLEDSSMEWGIFNSAAMYGGIFRDKVLISTRCKSDRGLGLYEYDPQTGNYVGILGGELPSAGTVVYIVASHQHAICCTNTGKMIILRPKGPKGKAETGSMHTASFGRGVKRQFQGEEGAVAVAGDEQDSVETESIESTAYLSRWQSPQFLLAHPSKQSVYCGCVLSLPSNLDVVFTMDRTNHLAVTFIDKGKCVRSFINAPPDDTYTKVVSICAIGTVLYVARSNGTLVIVNLSFLLDGSLESAGNLWSYVVAEHTIYPETVGISSFAIISPNGFLGLRSEDEVRNIHNNTSRKTFSTVGESHLGGSIGVAHDVVEGHILVFGGGHEDATVKLFHIRESLTMLGPHTGTTLAAPDTWRMALYELITLSGHQSSVTHLAADACGRYLFTASAADCTILVWDALSFTCIKRCEDVSIGHVFVGPDCLVVTSFKPPFIRFWKVPTQKHQASASRPTGLVSKELHDQLYFDEKPEDVAVTSQYPPEFKPALIVDITTRRSASWCYAMLKGASIIADRTPIVRPNYLEDEFITVLQRWTLQYHRMEAALVYPITKESVITSKSSGARTPTGASTPAGENRRRLETPRARARRTFESMQLFGEEGGKFPMARQSEGGGGFTTGNNGSSTVNESGSESVSSEGEGGGKRKGKERAVNPYANMPARVSSSSKKLDGATSLIDDASSSKSFPLARSSSAPSKLANLTSLASATGSRSRRMRTASGQLKRLGSVGKGGSRGMVGGAESMDSLEEVEEEELDSPKKVASDGTKEKLLAIMKRQRKHQHIQFSDSDDEEEHEISFVKLYDDARVAANEKKREDERIRSEVAERQQKLRPRMITHLLDIENDSDD